MSNWFEVDQDGLAKLVERRGKSFVVYELLQNAWDEDSSLIELTIEAIPGKRLVKIAIEDDSPCGFSDLTQSFTLFAESKKKGDSKKRGRFNLGEKLVLSLCDSATIISTTGGVRFDSAGRHRLRLRRSTGTRFEALLRMTRDELSEVLVSLKQLRPPSGIVTRINGLELTPDTPVSIAEASILTEVADETGVMRQRRRKTEIRICEPKMSTGWIYEMGIPICETGDRYDVDVQQKVPLSMERESVSPAYLREIRTATLNAVSDLLTNDEASANWVAAAMGDADVSDEAVKTVLDKRFGKNRVTFDPSDMEANSRAVAAGYVVVHGGSMSASEWSNARRVGGIVGAGRLFPTPEPYTNNPEAELEDVIPFEEWTDGMRLVSEFSKWAANVALGVAIDVKMTRAGRKFLACYGGRQLTFNVEALGNEWFHGSMEPIVDLIIHELAHEAEKNHLSEHYYNALSMIGAKLFTARSTVPMYLNSSSVKG